MKTAETSCLCVQNVALLPHKEMVGTAILDFNLDASREDQFFSSLLGQVQAQEHQ